MTNLPVAYQQQMKRLLGEAGFFAYEQSLSQPVTRALRVNLLLCPDGTLPCEIEGVGRPVPWAKGCYFVTGDARPGLSPLHEGGLFYLQEPSALSAVSALNPRPGERVLDLCAAPGGKSTQIAGLMGGKGLLVCNEPVPSRAQILSRNVERMGVRNAVVTCAMPDQLAPRFPTYFDRILVDAPCSGEGMFRRQPEAREEWTENSPQGCADRAMEILESASKMLKPGGYMVYSTCTFNDTENEGVLTRFLDLHSEFEVQGFMLEGLPSGERGYIHLYPHEIEGEGHFVSLLHKKESATWGVDFVREGTELRKAGKSARGKGKAGKPEAMMELPDVLANQRAWDRLYRAGECLWALPEGLEWERLEGLRVLRTGLLLSRMEGKRAEPDHALAMALRPEEAVRTTELSMEQALAYQAGEVLELGDRPAGYTLLTCKGISLGFGKQAGGMMKNHYPKGLRRR